jgi:hypothetical protein
VQFRQYRIEETKERQRETHLSRIPGPTGTKLLVLLNVNPTESSSSTPSPQLSFIAALAPLNVLVNDNPLE